MPLSAGFNIVPYIMGLDFANVNDHDTQKNDLKDNSMVARGSFNAMFLGEYSLINLNSPLTRVPIYAGCMYIFKPLDGYSGRTDSRHFAFVLGIGIDISLFGKK